MSYFGRKHDWIIPLYTGGDAVLWLCTHCGAAGWFRYEEKPAPDLLINWDLDVEAGGYKSMAGSSKMTCDEFLAYRVLNK